MAIELKRPNDELSLFRRVARLSPAEREDILNYIAMLELMINPIEPHIIRERRIELDMTQAELALRVGVGTPHISKIERGKDKPSPALQATLLLALGLNAQTIVTGT